MACRLCEHNPSEKFVAEEILLGQLVKAGVRISASGSLQGIRTAVHNLLAPRGSLELLPASSCLEHVVFVQEWGR